MRIICRSADEGRTWSAPQKIFEPDISRHPVSTTTRVAAVSDGSLVAWTCLFDRLARKLWVGQCGDTTASCQWNSGLLRSSDAGRNWTTVKKVDLPTTWREFETCSPIIQDAKHRWLVPTSPVKNFAGEQTNLPAGLAWWFEDEGKTWPGSVTLFPSTPTGLGDWSKS